MGQFLPADFSKGDANTLGGYMAVHARPAAFEASDGASYSVEIVTDELPGGGTSAPAVGGYLLFVRWSAGDPVAGGHLETDYLARGPELEVLREIGALTLQQVHTLLESLVKRAAPAKPWWDVMRDENEA